MEILESGAISSAYRALDILKYQQELQAKNLAFAEVDGFKASLLDIESVINEVKTSSDRTIDPSVLERHTGLVGGEVEVDVELMNMQETVMRYKTIIDLISRRGELMNSVMGSSR